MTRQGRLTAEQGAQGAIRYRRDALGNPESLTLPDGRKTEWLMYGSGHVQGIRYNGRLVSDITRDGLHREIIRSQGALTQYSGYTRSGQMAWQRIIRGEYAGSGIPPEAESENRKDWRYSADGELIMETGPHGAELYDYDRAGWLRSHAPAQGVQERFHWDKAGNPVNEYETVADNRVRAWGKYRYEYDEWGQVILRGEGRSEKTLAWDADGHLLRVISGDRTTHYRYDALGRRTHKVTRTDMQDRAENETHFLWQGTRLLEERTGESRKTYIYGDARSPVPVACAERRAGREEIYHYQTDPSLRIRTVTDETGKVVWDGCWQAWGRMQADLSGPGGFEQNLRLAGQYYDRESGLHYNLFRYYDPDVPGRFLSSDPIGLAGGINLYRYAPNALGWIDPLGLIKVFRNLRADESVSDGLSAKAPGRGMSAAGHVRNGSKSTFKGSQFISTTTSEEVARQYRGPGQTTVTFDTDNVIPDAKGNRSIIDLSTTEKATEAGLKGPASNYATSSSEVLVEGHVPPDAITTC
nr:RHS repeat-associated core domain-containing protein [Escherichia sp. 93.1447]